MKRLWIVLISLLEFIVPLLLPLNAYAVGCGVPVNLPQTVELGATSANITVTSGLLPDTPNPPGYEIYIPSSSSPRSPTDHSGGATFSIPLLPGSPVGKFDVTLISPSGSLCVLGSLTIANRSFTCELDVASTRTDGCVDEATIFTVTPFNLKDSSGHLWTGDLEFWNGNSATAPNIHFNNGQGPIIQNQGPYALGASRTFQVGEGGFTNWRAFCTSSITVQYLSCDNRPTGTIPGAPLPAYDPRCDSGAGIKTALGCIPVDAETFVNIAMPWAIGLGAGIAFLLGVYGAILIILSAGNPEKMEAGKELITSAIAGLLIIVFAITILSVTGQTILKLF